MTQNFTLLFYLKKAKTNAVGEVPIYLRITINGKRSEISTKRYVDPLKWSSAKGRLKGNTEEVRILNAYLEVLNRKVYDHHLRLEHSGKSFSSEDLKNAVLGISHEKKTLIQVYEYHNERMKALIGKEFSEKTYSKYKTSLMHLKDFLKSDYRKSDIDLSDLTFRFITDYEFFLLSKKNLGTNCSNKYLTHLKKIIRIAYENEWIEREPFKTFKMKNEAVQKDFLTEEELELLMNKDFEIQRVEQVRDVFVFCCFTGLSFSDVQKLTSGHIIKGVDSKQWIHINRTKNEKKSRIPLLPDALAILKKYEDHPVVEIKGVLLPVLSNQKMNAYLKEVADLCGIKKNLTMHMARHTFATWALSNGVPLETVAQILGHSSLKTTQIYAKLTDHKIARDTKVLERTLSDAKRMKIA